MPFFTRWTKAGDLLTQSLADQGVPVDTIGRPAWPETVVQSVQLTPSQLTAFGAL